MWQPNSLRLGFLVELKVQVHLLARVTLLCSWTRQFILSVPAFLNANPAMD